MCVIQSHSDHPSCFVVHIYVAINFYQATVLLALQKGLLQVIVSFIDAF